MNALILSAVSGVLMMFSGFALSRSAVRILAQVLLFLIVVATFLELRGVSFFQVNLRGMMSFDKFALLFSLIAALCTWVFSLLSARDMEKVGTHYSDYFALIFFHFVRHHHRFLISVPAAAFSGDRNYFHSALYPGRYRKT